MKYKQHPVDDEGWTGWIYPRMDGYRMGCCDCGLVHELQFMIVDDGVAFRARRNNRSTAAKRRMKAKVIHAVCDRR